MKVKNVGCPFARAAALGTNRKVSSLHRDVVVVADDCLKTAENCTLYISIMVHLRVLSRIAVHLEKVRMLKVAATNAGCWC